MMNSTRSIIASIPHLKLTSINIHTSCDEEQEDEKAESDGRKGRMEDGEVEEEL